MHKHAHTERTAILRNQVHADLGPARTGRHQKSIFI